MEELNYTWTDFSEDLEVIEKALEHRYDTVIGVAKGGLPLAVKVSNILGLPLKIVEAHSYTQKKQAELVIEQYNPIMWGPKILLVDDICDTGDTLKAIKENLEIWHKEVEILVIFKRNKVKFSPDHFLRKAKVKTWIKFPWE